MNGDKYFIESLDKAMRVAEVLLGGEGETVRMMDIAGKVGISRNNVFRILSNFERRGWATRINGGYRLGGKLNDWLWRASGREAWEEQVRRLGEEVDKLRAMVG